MAIRPRSRSRIPTPPSPRRRIPRRLALLGLAGLVAACAGSAGPAPEVAGPAPVATEAEWQALATPRPEPLEGAPRVALADVQVLAQPEWPVPEGMDPALAVQALATAALLERRSVVFVERRRFGAAADAERRGEDRPPAAPPAGVSPGAEFLASATWSSVGLAEATLELRLTDAATGETVAVERGTTGPDAGPVTVARTLVDRLAAALTAEGRRPEGADAAPGAGPSPSPAAVRAFLRGLAAEDRWAWETARVAYQEALDLSPAFPEARAALARTARLRIGGTLGES